MTQYRIFGPYEVEVEPVGKTRRIVDRKKISPEDAAKGLLGLKGWWHQDHLDKLRSCKGCYIFAMRAGKGATPVYVGKTSKRMFEAEVFNARNIKNMNGVLAERKGTLILYLVSNMRANARGCHVDEIETWLIDQAKRKNPNLKNDQKTKDAGWCICGLTGDGRTAQSESAAELAKTLNLNVRKKANAKKKAASQVDEALREPDALGAESGGN